MADEKKYENSSQETTAKPYLLAACTQLKTIKAIKENP